MGEHATHAITILKQFNSPIKSVPSRPYNQHFGISVNGASMAIETEWCTLCIKCIVSIVKRRHAITDSSRSTTICYPETFDSSLGLPTTARYTI